LGCPACFGADAEHSAFVIERQAEIPADPGRNRLKEISRLKPGPEGVRDGPAH
jgi:hypothetical protein